MADLDTSLIFKALAHPVRRQILTWLRSPDGFEPQEHPDSPVYGICLSSIQHRAGTSQSMTSQHMAALERADLVRSHRLGQWTHYRRNEDVLERFAAHVADDL
ncbi:helix-turn-helix transcriptional regulator [Microlunatus spumicola]|uniref:Helix-turn-helix transcriptional regulator n=1 Tax=Microlunatus spumicola TaxID=81499 RepID=A0ABP6XR07_9ACTN